jgi:hypothetical protein
MGIGVVTRSKRRRLDEEQRLADRISSLPDDVLGEIVSLLPTRAGARTQVLSSRWRHIWRSAPLNMDLHPDGPEWRHMPVEQIRRVLSAHPGPGRRLSVPSRFGYLHWMDGWLRSAAALGPRQPPGARTELTQPSSSSLVGLAHAAASAAIGAPLLVHPPRRLLPRLRVSDQCQGPRPSPQPVRLPRLQQLTLSGVTISEGSLHAMLAGAPALRSLLLLDSNGFARLQIASCSIENIGVRSRCRGAKLQHLVLEDTPSLKRLLLFEGTNHMDISVVSAPRLDVFGKLCDDATKLKYSSATTDLQVQANRHCYTTMHGSINPLSWFVRSNPLLQLINQGSPTVSVLHSVKLLALSSVRISLHALIDLLKCVPHLEKLYIEVSSFLLPCPYEFFFFLSLSLDLAGLSGIKCLCEKWIVS